MTLLGEMYTAQGTQNTFCRSNRPIAVSECYGAAAASCPTNGGVDGKEDLQFYSFDGVIHGIQRPEITRPPRFVCEEP
jgi:hypothetical protein